MIERGELINLTQILNVIDKFTNVDNYGANNYTYYYAPLFTSSKILNNIPVLYLNDIDQYILLEFTVPHDDFIDNVNLINITPYFYSYQDIDVFASVDKTIEFFKPKVEPGQVIKVIFTSSKTIGDYFEKQGYLISKIPFKYIKQSTFNFLLRIGNYTGEYNPGSFIKNSKLILDKFNSFEPLIPYTNIEIINSLPAVLGSKYTYDGNYELNTVLLNLYNKEKNELLKNNYIELPTYLYLQNIPTPPVKYAFQSFYDSISVNPYVQIQANNTGESYFNTALLNLNEYEGKNLIILAVNQIAFGYALNSNIQIYNNNGLSVIPNGSYLTSPNIPVISVPTYPYINEKLTNLIDYPLINKKIYNIDELISQGINQIYVIERVAYNPINFSHSDNYMIPKLSVFISN